MSREDALNLLKKYIKNENLIKHGLAVEAVMKKLAQHFKQDKDIEKWALAGLLHDLDWELTQDNPQKHGQKTAEILEKEDIEEDIIRAIKAHNHLLNLPLNNLMEKALFCAEELTGLITATALVHPEKLAGVKTKSIKKKFKDKSFARGVNRDIIKKAPDLIGLSLEELIEISLEAMKENKEDLGL
jgi:uncharacterized protein